MKARNRARVSAVRRKSISRTKQRLGLIPREIYEDIQLEKRTNDIKNAIRRYLKQGLSIKQEWIDEYNELINIAQLKSESESF